MIAINKLIILCSRLNMINLVKTPDSIRRTVRYIEWTLIVVYFLLFLLNRRDSNYYSQIIPTYANIIYLTLCLFLSFIFPINHPNWQRYIYIFLEITFIILARVFGADFEILLYLVLVKSCFLVNRKKVIIIAFVSGIFWNIALGLSLPDILKFQFKNIDKILNELSDTNFIIIRSIINNTGVYLAASTFVILFSFVILAEQKSRQQAEELTKRVESLAANLERNRIAREIHDSLGHSLTTLDVQLELAQRLYEQDPIKAAKSLDIAKELSSQCLDEVRRSVQTMRQSNFNLSEALKTLAQKVERNQSFVVRANIKLPCLPVQISHQLYCIVQEGFTNIQKHAEAKLVTLNANTDSDGILLELRDDGRGFNVDGHHTGFGLRGMQERVSILGGELTIKSYPEQGTKILVWIPV